MKFLKHLGLAISMIALMAVSGWSQLTLGQTTLSSAVSLTPARIFVASSSPSARGIVVGMLAVIDREVMTITAVSGTTLTVTRGGGTVTSHTSGEVVYIDYPQNIGLNPAGSGAPIGACTSTAERVLPRLDPATGDLYRCTNSEWDREVSFARLKSKLDLPLTFATTSDGRTITLNSRNYTQTSGSSIGFQSKPAQAATTTGSVIGAEISPRINNTFTTANIIGLHVDAYVRGTTARTISGDVRGQQIELVTDDAATNTISGDVVGLRMRAAFSATTVTGHMVPFKVEIAETQTNSQAWDALFKLTGTGDAWGTDTGSGDTESGFIKVLLGSTAAYIVLYSDAP